MPSKQVNGLILFSFAFDFIWNARNKKVHGGEPLNVLVLRNRIMVAFSSFVEASPPLQVSLGPGA